MTYMPRNGHGAGASGNDPASGLRAFLARVVRETGVPGIAVAIRAGGREMSAAAGHAVRGTPIGVHHRLHAGCTIKLLLAVVALELAARGRLELEAPIGDALPELRGTRHGEAVRVSHLLSHTSGYRGTHLLDPATRALDWAGLIEHLRAAPQLFVPGMVFSYEHTESILLGRILERATGRDPLALVREMLLEPLGLAPGRLSASPADPQWAGRHDLDRRCGGGFVPIEDAPALPPFWNAAFSDFTLSTSDLATIAEALAGAGGSAIGDATRDRLRRTAVRLPPVFGGPIRELLPVAFGLGAAAFPGELHGHNGLTYGQCVGLRYSPARQLAVAIGMNATLPHLRDHVLDAVCAELIGRPPAGPPPRLDLELGALGGVYLGPGRSRAVAAYADGRLELRIEHGEHRLPVELVVDEERRLVVRSPLPQLSVGFFSTATGDIGLMLGVSAFKRVSSGTRRAPVPASRAAAAEAEVSP